MKHLIPAIMAVAVPAAHAAVTTLPVTGWAEDIVINGAGPYDASVTGTMDGGPGTFENWTWIEQGTYLDSSNASVPFDGLVAGPQASLTGSGTFEFQDFSGANSLLLPGAASGTLTLETPASFQSLALFGSTSGGATSATITLTFSDASTTLVSVASGTGIGTDWFNGGADRAVIVGGRASNKSEEGYTLLFRTDNDAIAINETFLTLSAADQAKTLTSVTITNDGGGRMAVLAISAEAVPEPSSAALLGLFGTLGLLRRRR